jgi:hypothetical protein
MQLVLCTGASGATDTFPEGVYDNCVVRSPEIQDALAKAEPLSEVELDNSASAHIIGRDCKHLQWETEESWLWSWGFVHARIASATMDARTASATMVLVCSCYPHANWNQSNMCMDGQS